MIISRTNGGHKDSKNLKYKSQHSQQFHKSGWTNEYFGQ